MTGAASELTDAILVNPYDIDGVADSIHKALCMPLGERQERHQGMIEILKRNDITAWRTSFMEALVKANERIRLAS
jgi:trehalose 6-phosphate synthase